MNSIFIETRAFTLPNTVYVSSVITGDWLEIHGELFESDFKNFKANFNLNSSPIKRIGGCLPGRHLGFTFYIESTFTWRYILLEKTLHGDFLNGTLISRVYLNNHNWNCNRPKHIRILRNLFIGLHTNRIGSEV